MSSYDPVFNPETYYYATGTEVTSIANAIRTKGGTSSQLEFPDDFVEAIENLEAVPDLTSITITPSNEVQHFGKGQILVGKYYYNDGIFLAQMSDLTRMSEIQAGDTCYITGILYCSNGGVFSTGSRQDISGTFVWQDGTNTYAKNGYTLSITKTTLSVTQSTWNGAIYGTTESPDGTNIIGVRKIYGDQLVAKTYIMDGIVPAYSDFSGLANMQAGDVCKVTGTLRALEAGATVAGSLQDLSGSFTWVDGTNTYTKGPYTFTITSSSISLSHPYTGSLEVDADSHNPDGQYIIGFHKVFPYDGWNDITVNPPKLTDRTVTLDKYNIKYIAGYDLIDSIILSESNGQSIPVDLSSIHDGDICYVKGKIGLVNGQFDYDVQDLEGSFVWSTTNTYVKGSYTLTITATNVSISHSQYTNVEFNSSGDGFGYSVIGFAIKKDNEDGFKSIRVYHGSQYLDASTTNATQADVIAGKRFGTYGTTQYDQTEHAYIGTGSLVVQHYYTGSSTPSSSLGVNGDIYLKT